MSTKKAISVSNKKAFFDYQIIETYEAGIVLSGDEIKAIREGRINITGSYVKLINAEVFWLGGDFNNIEDRQRTRKLLLHEEEIKRLAGKSSEDGLTIIPLRLYLKRGKAKLEIGIGKGLKKYDKREKIKKRDTEREVARRLTS
jgi:SsrA-binding protein